MENTQNTEIRFTSLMGKWVVTGPAELITEGATVNVSKKDGTTTSVYIRSITGFAAPTEGHVLAHFIDSAKRDAETVAATDTQAIIAAHAVEVAAQCADIYSQIAARNAE